MLGPERGAGRVRGEDVSVVVMGSRKKGRTESKEEGRGEWFVDDAYEQLRPFSACSLLLYSALSPKKKTHQNDTNELQPQNTPLPAGPLFCCSLVYLISVL